MSEKIKITKRQVDLKIYLIRKSIIKNPNLLY